MYYPVISYIFMKSALAYRAVTVHAVSLMPAFSEKAEVIPELLFPLKHN